VNSTWEEEAGMFAMIQEEDQQGSVYMTKGLQPYEVLLDNQANISIVNTIAEKHQTEYSPSSGQRSRRNPVDCR
jgi:hypothetical protein